MTSGMSGQATVRRGPSRRLESFPIAGRILLAGMGFCALMGLGGLEAMAGTPSPRAQESVSPDYTVFAPAKTNTNIQGVVLSCERATGRPILELHVYVRDHQRLLPNGPPGAAPKVSPGATIVIDDQTFPTDLRFADRYAALVDRGGEDPALSNRLVAALLGGTSMVLRFDLVEEAMGQPAGFDGEATIPLVGEARNASRTVEQCVDPLTS
jgi:hypothetical protein